MTDVTARDGLQSWPDALPPAQRQSWILRLLQAGVPEVEAGAFVRPDLLPQMAGTEEVLSGLRPWADRLWVVVPNLAGLIRAIQAGAKNVHCLLSATESHSQRNLGGSVAEVLRGLGPIFARATEEGLRPRAALSMAWIDPLEGRVPTRRALELCRALGELGFAELTLCDTLGHASPEAVAELVAEVLGLFPARSLGLHLHDGAGQAAASVEAGLALGVTRFEAALAGLGGCPFAPGSTRNLDTEALVRLLHARGLSTGIEPQRLAEASASCLEDLHTPPSQGPKPRI